MIKNSTITAHEVDVRGVYLRSETLSTYAAQPEGAVYAELPDAQEGHTRMWLDSAWQQVPDAEVPPLPPAKPPEEIRAEIMDGVQRYLDDFAQTKTYDGILSACTYATSTVPRFAAEGQYCVEARDACWDAVASIEAEVLAGNRPAPSGFEDIRDELPTLSWPPVGNQTP